MYFMIRMHELRFTSCLCLQDPVLFTGSVRKNLDPFSQHGDVQLWAALEEVSPLIFVLVSGEILHVFSTEVCCTAHGDWYQQQHYMDYDYKPPS